MSDICQRFSKSHWSSHNPLKDAFILRNDREPLAHLLGQNSTFHHFWPLCIFTVLSFLLKSKLTYSWNFGLTEVIFLSCPFIFKKENVPDRSILVFMLDLHVEKGMIVFIIQINERLVIDPAVFCCQIYL